ncbi:MAG: PucR family transcriptional regulator [Vulcanimicrobiaceae bacterium]
MTPDEIVDFAEGLARVAAAGAGAKALAAHLAAATGLGVLIEDDQWRPIAAAGRESVPVSARGLTEDGGAHANGRPGYTCPIVAGVKRVGWLSVFSPQTSGSLGDCGHALRLTAASIAVELARDPNRKGDRRKGFWERIAAGDYHDAAAARDDAATRGIVAADAYVAIVLETEHDDPDAPATLAELRAAATEAFRNGAADSGFIERGSALIVLAPAPREYDASNARTAATLLPKALAKRKPGTRVSGGVGTAEPVANVAPSLERATAALAIGRRIFGPGRVAAFEDLGAYPLLYSGASRDALRAFSRRVLAPLRAYDEKHQTELERTLALYFDVGQNVKTAAERLHVHRHTVFYRLRQIGEICSCSLENPGDQLTLRLAIAIHALNA